MSQQSTKGMPDAGKLAELFHSGIVAAVESVSSQHKDSPFKRKAYDVIEDKLRQFQADTVAACAEQIPTSWLDNLLTGPDAVVGKPPYNCPDIERLLSALQTRIRAIADDLRSR